MKVLRILSKFAGGLALLVGFAFLSGLTLRVGIRAFLLGWRGF